jgi:hypothetical protein
MKDGTISKAAGQKVPQLSNDAVVQCLAAGIGLDVLEEARKFRHRRITRRAHVRPGIVVVVR